MSKHSLPDPSDWLFTSPDPAIRYFARRELGGETETAPAMTALRCEIAHSPRVKAIFQGQHAEGYWFDPDRYRSETKFYGTAWRFLYLAQFGVDGSDPRVRKTAEFLLARAWDAETGGFKSHVLPHGAGGISEIPCFNGALLWAYLRFGWIDDPRIQRNLGWVVEHARFDDGEVQEPAPEWMRKDGEVNGEDMCWGRHSCIRGVGPVLQALSEIPPERRTPEAREKLAQGIEFVLKHHVYKKSHDLGKQMNGWITQLAYPTFDCDLLELLTILAREGVRDERMADGLAALKRKQGADGRWRCQRSLIKSRGHRLPFEEDELGEPSEWVSVRALAVLKRYADA